MSDEELDEARKKKLETKKIEEQLKSTLRIALDEAAYDRLMNVSLANNELYLTAAKNVLMLHKRVERRLTEKELLMLLKKIKEQTETKSSITFHRK
jgi:DNA-binding TFAR19-related protein (PDSD5 family)